MSATTVPVNSPKLAAPGFIAEFAVLASEIIYAGGIVAGDYAGEIQMASDALGLRVLGIAGASVDNTVDGHYCPAVSGVFRFANSTTSPVTRSMVGMPCFVEDDSTVAGVTTNYVAAGLVVDVDSDGVWVDMTQAALTAARAAAPKVFVAKTDNFTVTAAQAFAGNVVFTGSKSSLMTFTLPSAVGGYKVGIQRLTAGAGYDVAIQAASGDTVLGSAAAKKVDNTVDAVSGIVYIKAADATAWILDGPIPADYASWVVNDT